MRCSSDEDGPDVARPRRDHEADQLLHRPDVGEVVRRRGHVVHAVGVRDVLEERVELEELLGAAVEIADDRVAVDDPLAVDLELQAQHAVGGRVLRAEVELHLRRPWRRGLAHQRLSGRTDWRVRQRTPGQASRRPGVCPGRRRGGLGGFAGFQPVPVPADRARPSPRSTRGRWPRRCRCPRRGKSLRSGMPLKPSQRRMRVMSGCPSKRTPYMS